MLEPKGSMSSDTCLKKEYLENRVTRETHWIPETQEEIVVDSWYVQDGEDDVSPEFEIISINGKHE